MSAARYLVRTHHPAREGRKVLGMATGPKPAAFDEVVLLPGDAAEPAADAEPVLTITPNIRKQGRKGGYELGGPLSGGARVERRGMVKFAVVEADGQDLATIRLKHLPHRLRVEHRSGGRVQLKNKRATLNVVTAVKRSATGGVLSTWEGEDGLRVEVHAGRGYAIVDEARWPSELRLALIAAVIGVEFSIDPSDLD